MRWGILILVGVFFVSFASAAIPGDCDNSMIAYWQFEDDVLDSYKNGYDGGWDVGDEERYGSFVVNSGARFGCAVPSILVWDVFYFLIWLP